MRKKSAGAGKWRPSLASALTAGLTFAMAFAIGLVGFISLGVADRNTRFLLRQSGELAVGGFVEMIDVHKQAADNQAAAIAHLLGESPEVLVSDERVADVLRGALYSNAQVTGVAVVRNDGSTVAFGRGPGGVGLLDDPGRFGQYFIDFVEHSFAQAPRPHHAIAYETVLEVPIVAVGQAAMRDDQPVAVVAVAISLVEFSDFLDEADETLAVTGFILHGRDEVLAHHALADIKLELNQEKPLPGLKDVPDPILQLMWGPHENFQEDFFADGHIEGHVVHFGGEDYIFLYREYDGFIPDQPVLVGFHMPSSRLNNAFRQLIDASIYAGLVALVAVALIFLAGRGLARPIRRLGAASQAVADLRLEEVPRLGHSSFREVESANQAFNSMISALRRFETYVPRRLVRRMLELEREGHAPGSEEREITVLFTDIVNFTALAHDMPASRLAELLNQHFALLAEPIESENGTIDKYIGDSVMAFWGAPEPQDDHARRAIRAVREIARALAADNKRRAAAGEAPIQIRAGLHCGSVIVGDIGAPGRINYTAVGDAVNTAQRLEAAGKTLGNGGEVTVTLSEALIDRAKLDRKPIEGVHAVRLGPQELRGISGALVCYRLEIDLD